MAVCGCILIVVNSILLCISVVAAIISGLLAWSSDAVRSVLNNTLVLYIQTTFSGKMSVNATTLVNYIILIVQPIGVVLFILSILMVAICVLGIFAACYKSKVCLGLYLALLIAILITFIGLIIVYKIYPSLVSTILELAVSAWAHNYVSIASGDSESVLFASLMMLLNCCGSNSVTDITRSDKFSTSDTYLTVSYTNLVRPIPCCKFDSNMALIDPTCPTTSSSAKQNDDTGCNSVIRSYVTAYADIMFYVALVILAFFVALIVLASFVIAGY